MVHVYKKRDLVSKRFGSCCGATEMSMLSYIHMITTVLIVNNDRITADDMSNMWRH